MLRKPIYTAWRHCGPVPKIYFAKYITGIDSYIGGCESERLQDKLTHPPRQTKANLVEIYKNCHN